MCFFAFCDVLHCELGHACRFAVKSFTEGVDIIEERALCKLNHPNIVKLHSVYAPPGAKRELVLSYADGQTLDDLMQTKQNRSGVEAPRARMMFQQILSAVAHMHNAGIIHRDLNPRNVMVGAGDSVTIVDFGLSTLMPIPGIQLNVRGIGGGMRRFRCPLLFPFKVPSHACHLQVSRALPWPMAQLPHGSVRTRLPPSPHCGRSGLSHLMFSGSGLFHHLKIIEIHPIHITRV